MNKNKTHNICKFCNDKVIIYDNSRDGHMSINNNLYHFDCVVKYNYQKFCNEIIELKQIEELKEKINNNENITS